LISNTYLSGIAKMIKTIRTTDPMLSKFWRHMLGSRVRPTVAEEETHETSDGVEDHNNDSEGFWSHIPSLSKVVCIPLGVI
jgi:hypothetical protein